MFRLLLVIAAVIVVVSGYALYLATNNRLDRTAILLPILYIAAACLSVAFAAIARRRKRP